LSHSTPELYAAVTGAFVNKPWFFDPQKGMVFDPPGPQNIPLMLEHLKAVEG